LWVFLSPTRYRFCERPTIKYYNKHWQDYTRKTEALDMFEFRANSCNTYPKAEEFLMSELARVETSAPLALGFPTVTLEAVPAFARLLGNFLVWKLIR
jgi:hypothetical protein